MTPYREKDDHGRAVGSFVLDRRCGKLGRIKVASGTTDPEEFAALNAFVTKLKRERRWDLLTLIAQRLIRPLDLLDARDRGEFGGLPTPEEIRPLKKAVERWLEGADLAPRSRDDYAAALKVLDAQAKISQIPEILKGWRLEAIQSGKRQMFNNRLTALRSFIRNTLGDESRLFKLLPAELDVEHRPGNPQEPADIRALALHFPYPDELWALCLTGMRQSEYWGTWSVLADRIQVQGAKGRLGRPKPRVVPLVYRPAVPRVAYSTFYKALVRESVGQLNVHDLRKTAQRWWEDVGVPDWRIRLYAGHSTRGRQHQLDTIYRKPRDLTRLLVEDADRLRAYLGDPPRFSLKAVEA